MAEYATHSVSERTAIHMAESYDKMFEYVVNNL